MANVLFTSTRENPVASRLDEFQSGDQSAELDEAQQSPILVLSRYSALIETVRKAAPRGVPVVQAPDVGHALLKMRSLKSGVLIVDSASTDLTTMVAHLNAHFPLLVIVAAGQRDDSTALTQLTASGQIFRFLLVPLSHGQTRLTLDAAIAEHKRLIAATPPMAEPSPSQEAAKKRDLTGYIAFAIGVAISVAGIWWFLSRTSEPQTPVAMTTPKVAPPSQAVTPQSDPLQAELVRAQEAFARGEYIEPADRSALAYYRAALRIDANSATAQAGIRNVAGKLLERAESALTAQKLEEAVAAIEIARGIDPQQPRLATLEARVQLERGKLVQGQETGRRITALVAKAQGLTSQGRLVAPAGASALDALLEARRLDPTNVAVTAGSRDLAQALAQEASRLIKVGNLDEAQSLVTSARVLGSDGTALAAVESALSEARIAAANRQPRPAPLVKASPPVVAANPAKEPVARAPIESKPADPKPADPKAIDPKPIDARVNNAKEAPPPRAAEPARAENSAQVASVARDASTPGTDAGANQVSAESRTNPGEADIVPAASLRRIRTVEPVYPVAARRRKEQGMVEVLFTVTPDGNVENVEVRKSMPEQVFDEAAKKAVEQWRFEPVKVNGQAVSQRAFARLRFSMD